MRKIIIFIILLLVLDFSLFSDTNFDCFTIVVGREASVNGSVLLAHNEDDAGDFVVNLFNIPKRFYRNNVYLELLKGGKYIYPNITHRALWIEVPNTKFADTYINEYGVAIVSNACASREDKPKLTNGGISYMFRRIVGLTSKNARDAVVKAGKLIEKFGYNSSGRTYTIIDKKEAWMFCAVNGKHWVAQRIRDNHVALISNYYTIHEIDLNDTKNFLGSKDIISYAIKRGWYNPKTDGKFDFAKTYSLPSNYVSMVNILRQWRGTNLLSGKKYNIKDRLPFSFKPFKKINAKDLMNILRDHYEGTKYDLTDGYKKGNPNYTDNRTICTRTTKYSLVVENRESFNKRISTLVWLSLLRPDTSFYIPIYPFYDEVYKFDKNYIVCNKEDNALENHFNFNFDNLNRDKKKYFWFAYELKKLADKNYGKNIRLIKSRIKYLESLEFNIIEKLELFINKNKPSKDFVKKSINNALDMINRFYVIIVEELLKI